MAKFPREKRLTRPAEFHRVFERGRHRRVQVSALLTRSRLNNKSSARLGLAISKRSLRRAVDRNRVKRLIRESFREHAEQLPTVDIVVMGQAKLVTMENAVILRQLEVLWQRLSEVYASTGRQHQTFPAN